MTPNINIPKPKKEQKSNFNAKLRQEITLFTQEKYKEIPGGYSVEEFIQKQFPQWFSVLKEGEQKEVKGLEKILQNYLINIVDSGLMEPKSMTHPETGESITAEAVAILNRPGFFLNIKEKILDENGEYNKKPITILNVDITKLRNADMVRDSKNPKNPHTYADILLQQTSNALNDLVNNLDQYIEVPEGVEIDLGRYGGDEFVFSIIGDAPEEFSYALEELIKGKFELIESYYMDDSQNKIIRKPAAIKNNAVERYTVPPRGNKQDIFLHYLDQGLMFDDEQINGVFNKFIDKRGSLDYAALYRFLDKEKEINNIYKQDDITMEEKIRFLYNKYPEDGLMVLRAYNYDKNHGTTTANEVLKIVENVLYDSLLRARVQDFSRFKIDLVSEKYDYVWGFDMKFIKEINDNISYADADLAIRGLWNKILEGIDPQDKDSFTFTRRGGTYFVGSIKAAPISAKSMEHINSINKVNILSTIQNPDGIEVPIGKAELIPSLEDYPTINSKIKTTLNGLFDGMETDMYNSLLDKIVNMDIDEISTLSEPRSADKLTYLFFTGKRKNERIGKLIHLLNTSQTQYKDKLEKFKVLAKLRELSTYSSLPEQVKTNESESSSEATFFNSGDGFDYTSLNQGKNIKFEFLSTKEKIISLFTFSKGPKTAVDIAQTIGNIELVDQVNSIANQFDHNIAVNKNGEQEINLTDNCKKQILKNLSFDSQDVAKVIFDSRFSNDKEEQEFSDELDLGDFDFRNVQ